MVTHKQELLLGAHMSISGGFEKAIERGQSIGCTAIQIFTKSARQWHAREITAQEAQTFIQTQRESSIKYVLSHASYLINLASIDKDGLEKSIAATRIELQRCQQLEIPYLVLHPGTHGHTNEQNGLDRIATSLDQILNTTPGSGMILLENMAGQGSSLCYSFEQLAYIRKQSSYPKRLGVCLDTCHAFAAGYDLSTPDAYEQVITLFDKTVGLEHLKAIHLNDSKLGLGSNKDRHEEIGKGQLGLQAFELIMNDPRLFDVPKVLETPSDELADYAHNMAVLKKLISADAHKILKVE